MRRSNKLPLSSANKRKRKSEGQRTRSFADGAPKKLAGFALVELDDISSCARRRQVV